MGPALPGAIAVACYLTGTTLIWQRRRSEPGAVRADTALLIGLGLLLHAYALWNHLFTETGFYLGFYSAAALISWIMSLFVLLMTLRLSVQMLFLAILPVTALSLASALLLHTGFEPRVDLSVELRAHVLVSIVAYSVLFMAACQSVLLAVQERRLRRHPGRGLGLPPMETMEQLLFALLWTGLILLSIAIGTGFAFLDDLFAQRVVHHTVLSVLSWLIFALLLAGRYWLGWRSATAVRWTLIGFALLMLAYFGSKFVVEVLLDSP